MQDEGAEGFTIGDAPIGGPRTYVIAEAGANHDRDLAKAKSLIEAAADAGADAVKFQTYTAESLYSRFTPMISYLAEGELVREGETVWDLIKRVEIPWEWHEDLASHASSLGITFLSTPFDEAAVDLLEQVGVPAYKIASYELGHLPLIRYCAGTGKPLILSTAMASLGDIERALDAAREAGAGQIALMHCAVRYPPAFEDLHLRAITTMQQAFRVPIGWSDHTMGHTADVVAVALGATLIEKHFTLDRSSDGPDHAFALEPDELRAMVTAVREAEASLGSSVKRMTLAEAELAQLARRGLVAARDLPAGTRLTEADIAVKRPAIGIAPHELHAVLGRAVAEDLPEDAFITWDVLG